MLKNNISISNHKTNNSNSWFLLKAFFSKFEISYFILMLIVLIVLLITTPNYRNVSFIIRAISRNVEYGLIAFMMTFIIIAGMIDLSVASIMTLSTTVTGLLYHNAGFSMPIAVILGLATGVILGMINGSLVAYLKIQPIIITIGTLNLYRGISKIFIGDHSLGHFPDWFNRVDRIYLMKIGNIKIPVTIIGLVVVLILMFFILKYTSIGRKIYAIGINETAAEFSGINVKRLKFLLFSFSGLIAASAGMLYISRLLVVRHDMAQGGELDIVTMVVLGGTSIVGGKGNVIGSLWGLLIVMFVRTGLSVAGLPVDQQLFVIGALLLLAVSIPDVISLIRESYLNKKIKRSMEKAHTIREQQKCDTK
jgi:rhamnose transport system permease protein